MRHHLFITLSLVLVAVTPAQASGSFRVEAGGGAVRVVSEAPAGASFGVLCAPAAGRGCALVLYPHAPSLANGDVLSVEVAVDGGPVHTLVGVAFEDTARGAAPRLGVAIDAPRTFVAALGEGSDISLAITRGSVTLGAVRFELEGLAETLARAHAPQVAPTARRVARRFD